jgi:hypothetical protein
VIFYAQTIERRHINCIEKGKVDNYLQETRTGPQCLHSNLDFLQRRYKAGFMGYDSLDKVEDNLKEAAAICDDTIDSLIDLHMAILAQGVPYDHELPDKDFTLFERYRHRRKHCKYYTLPPKSGSCHSFLLKDHYDWEIHKGHLEVFDKYGFRYIFDISVFIALK